MRPLFRANRIRGMALLLAIFSVGIMTVIAAAYLKMSRSFKEETHYERLNREAFLQAKSGIDNVRKNLMIELQKVFQTSAPSGGFTLIDPAKTPKVLRPIDPPEGEEYTVICEHEGIATTKGPCTLEKAKMPKAFKTTYRVTRNDVTYTVIESFEIAPTSLNQFSYLLTNVASDFPIGSTTFAGNVGIFFENPSTAKLNFVRSAGNAQFKGVLITNLPNRTSMTIQPGTEAPKFEGGVVFSVPATNAKSAIVDSFDTLKQKADYSGINSWPSRCGGSPDCMEGKVLDPSKVVLGDAGDPCHVRVVQNSRWFTRTYTGPSIDPEADPSGYAAARQDGNNWSTPTIGTEENVIFNGRATDNTIIYIPGNSRTIVEGGNRPEKATVCSKGLFLSQGNLVLGGSIVKDPDHSEAHQANIVLMSQKDIGVDANTTRLLNGNTITQQRMVGNWDSTGGSGATSLKIQASLVAAGVTQKPDGSYKPTSFKISPGFATSSGAARNLGNLSLEGMIVSGEPTLSRTNFGSDTSPIIDGFDKVTFEINPTLSTSPPPGLGLQTDLSISATITSVTMTQISIDEAIHEVRKKSSPVQEVSAEGR